MALIDKYPNLNVQVDTTVLEARSASYKTLVDAEYPDLVGIEEAAFINAKNTAFDFIRYNVYPKASTARGVIAEFNSDLILDPTIFSVWIAEQTLANFYSSIASNKADDNDDYQQFLIHQSHADKEQNKIFQIDGIAYYDWSQTTTLDTADQQKAVVLGISDVRN